MVNGKSGFVFSHHAQHCYMTVLTLHSYSLYTASRSVPLYYSYIGDIDDIPMDFNFDINDVTFSSRTINLNRGFVLFLGTVCQLITPMILSSYYVILVQ